MAMQKSSKETQANGGSHVNFPFVKGISILFLQ